MHNSLNKGTETISTETPVHEARIMREVRDFSRPILRQSLGQIATSFGGFIAVCSLMYFSLQLSYWITLALAPMAAGFLVRIFIIQHDCGHASFFRSKTANEIVGRLSSLLTLTPYENWRRQHAGHHRTWNDLDRRANGLDIYSTCLTVAEYKALTPFKRRWYRLTRHPLVANILLPPVVFLLLFRVPFDAPKSWQRERRGVYLTDLGLAMGIVGLGWAIGFGPLVAVQLPVMILASIIGVWLFSVQHRFEGVRWMRHDQWRFGTAALQGSSYLRLPPILRWFTGNIGFHHVHHLSPRVPNYRLQECHKRIESLYGVPRISLRDAILAVRFALWDENSGQMVTFRQAGNMRSA